jgi:hypothetical protein
MRASFAVWAIFKHAFIVWTLSPAIKGGMLRTQQAGADMSDMMREKVFLRTLPQDCYGVY